MTDYRAPPEEGRRDPVPVRGRSVTIGYRDMSHQGTERSSTRCGKAGIAALAAAEMSLADAGAKVDLGAGVATAQNYYRQESVR